MNKHRIVRAFLFAAFLFLSQGLFAQKTVGILDITARDGVSASEASGVTDFVYEALHRFGAGKYQIISRQSREAILAEHRFSMSGYCDDTACALEVGKYLAADYVIIGSFMKFGSRYYLSLQLVDVNTTVVAGSAREGAETLDEVAERVVDACVKGVFGFAEEGFAAAGQDQPPRTTQAPVPVQAPLTAQAASSVERDMVFVEGGTYKRNASNRASGEDSSQSGDTVTVSGFYISRYEVTQSLFQEIMGDNPSNTTRGIGERHPVTSVSWLEAVKFCNRLSTREGLQPVYDINGDLTTCDWTKNGYRLPTEAEWEFAARGGITGKGFAYAGSGDIDEAAWYSGNSGGKTQPVGQKRANELGLYDMSGNVAEWCWDWYGFTVPGTSMIRADPNPDPIGS